MSRAPMISPIIPALSAAKTLIPKRAEHAPALTAG